MARIDTYENQTGIQLAGVVRENTNDAVGQALTGLGKQGVAYGMELRQEEERTKRKEAARAESLDNLRLQSSLLDHEDRVTKYAQEASVSFTGEGADGSGYQKNVADFAQKDAEASIKNGNFSKLDAEELPMRFTNSSRRIINSVGEMELTQGLKFQGDITDKKVKSLASKIALNPNLYDEAAKELIEFTTSTNVDRPKLQERISVVGLAKLQRARLEAIAGLAPDQFRDATAGVFSGTPSAEAPQHIRDVMYGAADAGVDPTTMLAIGEIESRLDPLAGRPKNKDGSDMSSAEGLFQVLSARDTLDELGITANDKRDTKKVSAAVASYVKRQSDVMKARGIAVTPGKQYMTWNLGPGVAMAVMTADPNKTIDEVLNSSLRSRSPEFRDKVLRNNPSLYRSGMTVREVIKRYDEKMATAASRVGKYATADAPTTDEQARTFFEKIMPGGAPYLTAADLGEVQLLAKAESAKVSREQQSLTRGQGAIMGTLKGDPLDSSYMKDVNEFTVKQGLATGLVEGDANAHLRAAKLIDNVGAAPEAFVNAYSASMAGGDMKSKLTTYAAIADLQARNPKAYDATKFQADDRARANEYVALTTVSNLSPDDAVARIDFYRSPEGKKQAEAQKAGLLTHRAAEVKELTDADVLTHFDEKWSMSSPKDGAGNFLAAATDAYKEQYLFFRNEGRLPDDAKSMALASLDKNWGSSRIADTGKGSDTQTFMPFPPEKAFNPTDVGYTWITDQAKNAATSMIAQRYPKLYASYTEKTKTLVRGIGEVETDGGGTKALKNSVGIKLVPDFQTAQEARANKPRGYRLLVRLPNGQYDTAEERFIPNQLQADRERQERFTAGEAAAKVSKKSNDDGIAEYQRTLGK